MASKSLVLLTSATLLGSLVLTSNAVFAQSRVSNPSPLTTTQKQQAAQVARKTVNVNYSTGYMSVTSSALTNNGLSSSQVNYVESTIQAYDSKLSTQATPPRTISPLSVSPNTPLWLTTANFTGQKVMLYQGAENNYSWGMLHMLYRHNWLNWSGGVTAVQIVVHQAQSHSIDTGVNNYGRELYNKWFISKNIPFFTYQVELQVVVQPGNATEGNNQYENGSVVTGYPIAGDYTKETWHGVPNTSIVPWWIGEGQYTQTLK